MKITGEMMMAAASATGHTIHPEDLRKAIEAALSAAPAGVVKPLEWKLSWGPDQDGDECHVASTPFGTIAVERLYGKWQWRYCFDEYYDEDQTQCDSLEDGKAAAQAMWDSRISPFISARIMSAIEPDGVGVDDWTVSDTLTAREILNYLGYGNEASLEPGIDRRRDKIAKMIRARISTATLKGDEQ